MAALHETRSEPTAVRWVPYLTGLACLSLLVLRPSGTPSTLVPLLVEFAAASSAADVAATGLASDFSADRPGDAGIARLLAIPEEAGDAWTFVNPEAGTVFEKKGPQSLPHLSAEHRGIRSLDLLGALDHFAAVGQSATGRAPKAVGGLFVRGWDQFAVEDVESQAAVVIEELRSRRIPVFPVLAERDPHPHRRFAVQLIRETILRGDPVAVRLRLPTQAASGKGIQIRLEGRPHSAGDESEYSVLWEGPLKDVSLADRVAESGVRRGAELTPESPDEEGRDVSDGWEVFEVPFKSSRDFVPDGQDSTRGEWWQLQISLLGNEGTVVASSDSIGHAGLFLYLVTTPIPVRTMPQDQHPELRSIRAHLRGLPQYQDEGAAGEDGEFFEDSGGARRGPCLWILSAEGIRGRPMAALQEGVLRGDAAIIVQPYPVAADRPESVVGILFDSRWTPDAGMGFSGARWGNYIDDCKSLLVDGDDGGEFEVASFLKAGLQIRICDPGARVGPEVRGAESSERPFTLIESAVLDRQYGAGRVLLQRHAESWKYRALADGRVYADWWGHLIERSGVAKSHLMHHSTLLTVANPLALEAGQSVAVEIRSSEALAGSEKPVLFAQGPDGQVPQKLDLQADRIVSSGDGNGKWTANWVPGQSGVWRLELRAMRQSGEDAVRPTAAASRGRVLAVRELEVRPEANGDGRIGWWSRLARATGGRLVRESQVGMIQARLTSAENAGIHDWRRRENPLSRVSGVVGWFGLMVSLFLIWRRR